MDVLFRSARSTQLLWEIYPLIWTVRCSAEQSEPRLMISGLSTAVNELKETGEFSEMNQETDEDEHSIEMHLPYIRKVFEG